MCTIHCSAINDLHAKYSGQGGSDFELSAVGSREVCFKMSGNALLAMQSNRDWSIPVSECFAEN